MTDESGRTRLKRNLLGLGFYSRKISPPGRMLTIPSESIPLTAYFGLNAFSTGHPGVGELISILTGDYVHFQVEREEPTVQEPAEPNSLRSFKEALAAWTRKYGTLQFLYEDEFPAVAARYLQESGADPKQELVNATNGFIAHDFYNWMIAQGYLPIADHHDLLGHSASLLIPGFQELMRRNARIIRRAYGQLVRYGKQGGNSSFEAKDGLSPGEALLFQAAFSVDRSLRYAHRELTHEDLVFLHPARNAGFRLVMHGNVGANLARVLMLRLPKSRGSPKVRQEISEDIVNRITYDDRLPEEMLQGGNLYLWRCPLADEFNRAQPGLHQRFQAAQAALHVGSMQDIEALRSRLRDIVRRNVSEVLEVDPTKDPGDPMLLDFLMSLLADEISRDPVLASYFHLGHRMEFWRASLDYYEAYLDWIQGRSSGALE